MANRDFIGVYMLPDREIVVDCNTSNEDLRLVIRKLADEIEHMRRERREQLHDFLGQPIMSRGL